MTGQPPRVHYVTVLLTGMLVASLLLAGCGADNSSTPGNAPAPVPAVHWLPDAEPGSLPRSLQGYRLQDPEPQGATPSAGGPFQSATELHANTDAGAVRVLSVDGRIFRVELIPQGSTPDAITAAVRERYGEPGDDDANWMQYQTGLGVGDVILGASKQRPLVFIEDPGMALAAYRAR